MKTYAIILWTKFNELNEMAVSFCFNLVIRVAFYCLQLAHMRSIAQEQDKQDAPRLDRTNLAQ